MFGMFGCLDLFGSFGTFWHILADFGAFDVEHVEPLSSPTFFSLPTLW
jgi:hypothetical protein